jgi:hypothetical protein
VDLTPRIDTEQSRIVSPQVPDALAMTAVLMQFGFRFIGLFAELRARCD